MEALLELNIMLMFMALFIAMTMFALTSGLMIKEWWLERCKKKAIQDLVESAIHKK